MSAPAVHRYGPHPDQFLELTVPDGIGPHPVAIVLHGGFWRAAYGVELARPLAADLAAAGWAFIDLVEADGTVRRAAVTTSERGRERVAARLRQFPTDIAGASPGSRIFCGVA